MQVESKEKKIKYMNLNLNKTVLEDLVSNFMDNIQQKVARLLLLKLFHCQMR